LDKHGLNGVRWFSAFSRLRVWAAVAKGQLALNPIALLTFFNTELVTKTDHFDLTLAMRKQSAGKQGG
jgi:hypothetical protein